MTVLIIFDSVFGNTEQVARAMGDALGADVVVLNVADVTPDKLIGVEFLVVGSPTRGFRPTEGISNFIKNLPANSLKGVKAVAFDTRIPLESIESKVFRSIVKMGGFADKPIAEALKKKSAVVLPGEGFFVTGEKGPLVEGELQRAADWIKRTDQSRKML
ncbi:MAG: flavodoxin/nitric oxide synthase [Chloroflexi bacterium]|nr:MAG: flavodoxin/nitric oxide synthase [Chloroflexota bacterium]MBA4375700.1 nitric oxide synthase [Anaerolinea sp.]